MTATDPLRTYRYLLANDASEKQRGSMLKKLLALITGNRPSTGRDTVYAKDVAENDLADEEQEEYAKRVQLITFKCQYAESCLEGIDDSGDENDKYERERLESFIQTALSDSEQIQDEFYKSAAFHQIANLLSKAGQYDRAIKLIDKIAVGFIREEATEFLAQQQSQAE